MKGVRERYAGNEVAYLLEKILEANNDDSLTEKLKRCYDIATGTEQFIQDSCPPESELQKKIVRDTYADPIAAKGSGMLSGHVTGQFVKLAAEMIKAKRILDVGMYTGYSTVTFAQSAYCEQVVSLDDNEYMANTFVKERIAGTPIEKKIRIMLGKASDSLATLKGEGQKFDLVFLDADKQGYLPYYRYIMDNGMLNENGVFLCDNILWYNDTILDKKTEGGKALWEFVEFLKQDERVQQMVFPFRDGVLLIKKKST